MTGGRVGLVAASALLLATPAAAQQVHPTIPARIDPAKSYLIYSHGRIVEGTNPRPVREGWGVYDFPAIQQALVSGTDWELISKQRPLEADVDLSADEIVGWVRGLITAGVPSHRITLIGFSKGGGITALASSRLRDLHLNTVLLATCWETMVADTALQFGGQLLSIYETSDVGVGSCRALASQSPELAGFEELAISTGKEHGAFFRPLPEWVDPLKAWVKKRVSAP
ncbi:MAG: alpha/beta hydrolase [Gemmatimonadales bacterium]